MGSFNVSCGLTNLPILEGEDAIGLFLVGTGVGERDYSSTTNTSQYVPIPVALSCKYNDYGDFIFEDNEQTRSIFEFLNANVLDLKEGENRYHECSVTAGQVTPENVFRLMTKGRLFTKDRYYHLKVRELEFVDQKYKTECNVVPISFVAFRKSAYDKVVNSEIAQEFKERALKFARKDVETKMSRPFFKDDLHAYATLNGATIADEVLNGDRDTLLHTIHISEAVRRSYNGYYTNRSFECNENMFNCYAFDWCFELLNKSYIPSVYAGQCFESEAYLLLSAIMEEEIEALEHYYDEDEDE